MTTISPPSAESKKLIEKGQRYYVPNYQPREMILDHGKGSRIWDKDGNEFIDFAAGIAVSALGHQDPDLLEALTTQAKKLWHTSNVFFTQPAIELAEALVEAAPFAERAYFCSSGGEANEAAVKLARKYAADKGAGPEAREIITFNGSFHGRTLAMITATSQPKYQHGFEPLPGGFSYVPFNDFDAIAKAVSDKTCAIMVEPVQGEGGIVPAAPGFLKHLRELCDKHDALLIYDEVQCGMGRTGRLFAHQHENGAEPDIMTLAKALGCGVPIGATLVGKKAEHTFQFGSHGSTYGGNPIMCAVARVALAKIQSNVIMDNVDHQGNALRKGLEKIGKELGLFKEVRGRGLMIGAELVEAWHGKAGALSEACRQHGVLTLVAGPNVMRLVPPLNISDDEVNTGLARIREALASCTQEQAA